jgi:hypothetical protein
LTGNTEVCRCWRSNILATLLLNLAVILAMSGAWSRSFAESDVQAAEYKLKAVMLIRFAGYVEWPPQAFQRPDSPIEIGIIGADILAEDLAETVVGRTIGDRSLAVRKVRRGESVAGLHVLFIGRSAITSANMLAVAKGKPVLTVTESEDAFAQGSIINFVVEDDKVRFDVALAPASAASLAIHSRLLSVARKVIRSPS